jgi:hypothetical protein
MRPLLFSFLVLFVFTQWSCVSSKSSLISKKYSPAELKEDADVLRNVLLEMHPSVGIYRARAFYETYFSNFVQGISDSLTEKEFRLKVKLLVDELHCGHTEVLYSTRYYKVVKKQKFNFSPYIFLPVRNRVYVIANLNKKQDSTIKKGAEILRINGIGTDSMLRHAKRFISSDGYNQSAKDHYIQLGFNSYYPGLFGRPDTFEVEYRQDKKTATCRYPAIQLTSMPSLPLGAKDDSLYKRYKRAKIKYRFLDEDKKSLIMRIEKFSHSRDGMTYHKIFKKLKKNNSENLVIDLRNNGGGSLANSYKLLSYLIDTPATQTLRTTIKNYPYRKYTSGNLAFKLTRLAYKIIGTKRTVQDTDFFVYTIKPRKKNHFDKKIYLLINGGSFSASCLVAAYLRDNPRAVFIGEETGGAREGCNAGITPFYKLPHTRLQIRVPAFRIVHDVSPQVTGQGIKPDVETKYGLKEILTRQDLELAKVKEMLKIP